MARSLHFRSKLILPHFGCLRSAVKEEGQGGRVLQGAEAVQIHPATSRGCFVGDVMGEVSIRRKMGVSLKYKWIQVWMVKTNGQSSTKMDDNLGVAYDSGN